jgi:hypothetical protein
MFWLEFSSIALPWVCTPKQAHIYLTGKGNFICKFHFIIKHLKAGFMVCAINHCIAVVAENTNSISRHTWV